MNKKKLALIIIAAVVFAVVVIVIALNNSGALTGFIEDPYGMPIVGSNAHPNH